MDVKEFEAIHKKIDTLKEKNIRAKASLEATKAQALEEFGTDDPTELEKKAVELDETLTLLNEKMDKQFEKLRGLTNWALV